MRDGTGAPETVKPSRVRLEFLDGFRGIAALYVVLYHFSIICWQDTEMLGKTSALFKLFDKIHFGLLFYGNYAVVLFIVLSGFCLTLPYVSRGEASTKTLVLKDFLYRRARRMCPPYYVALLLSLGVCALTGVDGPVTLGAVATHVLMVHNLTPYVGKLNAPMWSVALEFQIYLVFALVLFPLWRRFGLPVVLLVALVLGGPMVSAIARTPTSMITAFALGMAGAIGGFGARLGTPGFKVRSRLALLVLGGLLLSLIVIQNRNANIPAIFDLSKKGNGWVLDILFAAYCAFLFARCTICVRQGDISKVVALFEGRFFTFLGRFSYSLYLYHSVLLAILATYVPRSFGTNQLIFYYFGFGLPATLGIAYVLYLAVERHFLNSAPRAANA